jgi:hypothetical protein
MPGAAKIKLSLAPGFSPVWDWTMSSSRFNGFSAFPEAAEAAGAIRFHEITGLKPGANEKGTGLTFFQMPRPGYVFA